MPPLKENIDLFFSWASAPGFLVVASWIYRTQVINCGATTQGKSEKIKVTARAVEK